MTRRTPRTRGDESRRSHAAEAGSSSSRAATFVPAPSSPVPETVHGRGAPSNPKGRFERIEVELDLDQASWMARPPEDRSSADEPRTADFASDPANADPANADPADADPASPLLATTPTIYLRDASKSVISRNQSPDVPFGASINPYRGCEHGCIYCYARPSHELLGFSAGLDFETRILVKEDAPALLRRELSSPRWQPEVLGMSGVTDPYQPVEKTLGITRGCLEVLAELRHPVGVVTKNPMVARDADLLGALADHDAASVMLSITTLDGEVARRMEPRAGHPRRRLEAIRRLTAEGVPVGVLIAPVVPGLTDHELPGIVAAAAEAGAKSAAFLVLRLPGAVEGLFVEWLDQHYPERKAKILSRLRSLRGGRLHDARFGHRMRGEGAFAEHLRQVFHVARRRHGLAERSSRLSTAAFRRPNEQLSLFDAAPT